MANEEQLAILRQGAEVWNRWRVERLVTHNDFSDADLSGVDLRGAYLTIVNLKRADLSEVDLRGANLKGADLMHVRLRNTNFSSTEIGDTNFGSLDLRGAIGLEDVIHNGPSRISTDTLVLSRGKIPKIFLQGCGLSDADIEYSRLANPNLSNEEINRILYKIYDLRATQALQISPLFISYNHEDSGFVDNISNNLTKKGIRFWRDVHDMKAGRMEAQIDRAIRQNPTVLLVLSEHSIKSDWVEHEVRIARGLEKELGRDVLCPVSLDNSWKDIPWPKRIVEQVMEYNILDFSAWEDDSQFERMFRKLIDGLELFYKD